MDDLIAVALNRLGKTYVRFIQDPQTRLSPSWTRTATLALPSLRRSKPILLNPERDYSPSSSLAVNRCEAGLMPRFRRACPRVLSLYRPALINARSTEKVSINGPDV
ncbi:MAG: hypothetical protein WB579_24455 [Bryobacteraceae bacterium]